MSALLRTARCGRNAGIGALSGRSRPSFARRQLPRPRRAGPGSGALSAGADSELGRLDRPERRQRHVERLLRLEVAPAPFPAVRPARCPSVAMPVSAAARRSAATVPPMPGSRLAVCTTGTIEAERAAARPVRRSRRLEIADQCLRGRRLGQRQARRAEDAGIGQSGRRRRARHRTSPRRRARRPTAPTETRPCRPAAMTAFRFAARRAMRRAVAEAAGVAGRAEDAVRGPRFRSIRSARPRRPRHRPSWNGGRRRDASA